MTVGGEPVGGAPLGGTTGTAGVVAVGRVFEVDAARVVANGRNVDVGRVTETTAARAVSVNRAVDVGRAVEVNTAESFRARFGLLNEAIQTATRWDFGVELLSTSSRDPVRIPGFRVERASVRWSYRAVDPTQSVDVADASPRRTGTLVMEHLPEFNPLSVYYRIWVAAQHVDGTWVRFTLGTFTCSKLPGLHYDGAVATRMLSLVEVAGRWAERRLARPLTLAPGDNPVKWVKDDLQLRFREPDVSGIQDSPVTLGSNSTWDHDYITFDVDTPLIKAYDRAFAYAGYEPLYADVDGRPIGHPARDPQKQDTEWTFGLPSGTGVAPEIDIDPVTPELPNVVVVEARNGPSLLEEGDGRRTLRNDNDGPGSIEQRGRVVEQVVTVDADSQAELDRVAALVAQRLFAGGGWTLRTTARAVPLLGDSDVVSFAHSVGVTGRWLTTAYEFDLVAGEESGIVDMRYEAELLVGSAWVQGMAQLPAVSTSKVAWRGVAA